MWQKSNEIDFFINKVFIFFKHQNSLLGQIHTYGDAVATCGSSNGRLQPLWSSICPLHAYYTRCGRKLMRLATIQAIWHHCAIQKMRQIFIFLEKYLFIHRYLRVLEKESAS